MKRTSLKRKTPLAKKSKRKISVLKREVWGLFSQYIAIRDAVATTGNIFVCKCVTCEQMFSAFGKGRIQAGHAISGRTSGILFNERAVHGQCYGCNVWGHGKQAVYLPIIITRYGEEGLRCLIDAARVPHPWKDWELQAIAVETAHKALRIINDQREFGVSGSDEHFAALNKFELECQKAIKTYGKNTSSTNTTESDSQV